MKKNNNKNFAVLGLGRFGMSVVQTLSNYDVNILACDFDEVKVNIAAKFATHALQVDLSDENTLNKLGLNDYDVIVLAMGESFETSLIATMIAKEQGAKHIVVKAVNQRQKRILESIGADQVVLPEYEMGHKIAQAIVESNVVSVLEDADNYAIVEMKPLDEWINKTAKEANIRKNHKITVLAIKRNKAVIPVTVNTIINKDDILIVFKESE